MGVQYWSDDIILVDLPRRLGERGDLQRAVKLVDERRDCSVVVDFSKVGFAGCATLTRLLRLRQLLRDHGHRLVLCSVAPATRDVFTVARLDEVFDFARDKFAALAQLQTPGRGPHA